MSAPEAAEIWRTVLESSRRRWVVPEHWTGSRKVAGATASPTHKPAPAGEPDFDHEWGLDHLLLRRRQQLQSDFPATFSDAPLQELPNPSLMKDMEKAADRIVQALQEGERIVIFGDYDVDGTVSCAMLRRFFAEYSYEPEIYIPNRLTEGYGLNATGLEAVASRGARVVVTVDNGIAAVEACVHAKSLGLDVIITDHHEPPAALPAATAIVNPKQKDCGFPYKDLAGVGVAFFLLIALRRRLNSTHPQVKVNLKSYLDFVALGTIADMCPISGLNHLLTRTGLEVMNLNLARGTRPGLEALLGVAKVEPQAPITSEHVAFQIGPRLNAAGRLGTALATEELLSTWDRSRAASLAHMLDEENRNRRALEKEAVQDVLRQLASDAALQAHAPLRGLVLHETNWHPGVLGIVASRCVERFYTPTLVLTTSEGKLKGSGRSTDEINLFEILDKHRDHFVAFGGHAKAVGFTLDADRLEWLRETLQAEISQIQAHQPLPKKAPFRIDAQLALEELNEEVVDKLQPLEPFGFGNPRPRFLLTGVSVERSQPIGKNKDDGHCRLTLKQGPTQGAVPFTAFSLRENVEQEVARSASEGTPLNFVVEVSLGYWRGQSRLELRALDVAAGALFTDSAPEKPVLEAGSKSRDQVDLET